MTSVQSYQPHPTFFVKKVGSAYTYEKTLRLLLKKIESGQFQARLDQSMANWDFREMILKPYTGDAVHLPKTFDAWQAILERIFTNLTLSHGILTGRNEDGERFSPTVREAHKAMASKRLAEICVLENWFVYNKNILREIVGNF
ncbi:MAG: hypothetical protein WC405_20185 [Syntrophales bacterium]